MSLLKTLQAYAIGGLAWVLAVAFLFGLNACASVPVPPKTVEVPVAVRCHPDIGPEPTYPDTDAALKTKDGDPFGQVQLLLEGRLLRIQRDVEKSAALDTCENGPSVSALPQSPSATAPAPSRPLSPSA